MSALIALVSGFLIVVTIALVGCGRGPTRTSPRTSIESSRAKSYNSVHDLAADAQAVVLVTATADQSVDFFGQDHAPYTITTVSVSQTLRGSISGSAIKIRQLGGKSGPAIADEVPLLVLGTSYVLFLQRFTFGPGHDTDQYVIVGGGAGLFADQSGTLRPLDPESPDLPSSVTLAELQKLIAD